MFNVAVAGGVVIVRRFECRNTACQLNSKKATLNWKQEKYSSVHYHATLYKIIVQDELSNRLLLYLLLEK